MHNLLRPGTLLVRQRTRHVRLLAVRWARRHRSEQLLLRALRTPAAAAEITVSAWPLLIENNQPSRDSVLVYILTLFILFERNTK